MELAKQPAGAAKPTGFAIRAQAHAALLLLASLQWGCMESSPGQAQPQAQAVRMEAYDPGFPLCRPNNHLLILDEDAIRNPCRAKPRDCHAPRPYGMDMEAKGSGANGSGGKGGDGGHGIKGRGSVGDGEDQAGDAHKVAICHIPPGNPGNAKTLSVGAPAVKAHLDHGDVLGACEADNDECDDEAGGGGSGGNGGSGSGGGSGGKRNDRDGHSDAYAHYCEAAGHTGEPVPKVNICHRPPGNPANAKTLSVGAPAVKAHLAHGDTLGSCPAVPGDGGPTPSDCPISRIGYRGTVKYFAENIGKEIVLPGGEVGDEGWFAPTTIRIAWRSAGPDQDDGLRNYVEAGPGLGSPDAKGNPETLLENVPDLVPLRATGLARLEGRSVCAVVLDGEARIAYAPLSGNIMGPNLGKVAFQVLGTEYDSRLSPTALPSVRVRILDAEAVCADPLTLYTDAPAPASAIAPPDVEIPVCAVQENLINEPWNSFDSTRWRGDGDQAVSGGLFYAREGASSAAADWISLCGVPVEPATAIRFSNRVQLNSARQNDFAESGALFFVNRDNQGSFDDFVFVNVGYTMQPSKVFVELFGTNGGVDFDQYEETSLPYAASQSFNVDLWILNDAYHIGVAGAMIDTVALAVPHAAMGLFEVGVQQNSGGLRGLIDMTTLAKVCRTENVTRPRTYRTATQNRAIRLGRQCNVRNQYIRMAKERIKHCKNPPMSMRCLAKLKEKTEAP